ncbi:hypothetical protein LP419_30055 [Massilia sp. H-1]|nr:hypothetical protein LP419_30055 [Massilia sp. H-1]
MGHQCQGRAGLGLSSGPDPAFAERQLPELHIESMAATRDGHLLLGTSDGVYEGMPGKLAPVLEACHAESGAVWIASGGEEALATVKGVLYHRGGKGAWVARTLASLDSRTN